MGKPRFGTDWPKCQNSPYPKCGAVKIKQTNKSFVIDTSDMLSIICHPPIMPDTNSIVIHGLRPIDVESGMNYDEMLDKLLPFIGSRPIVGFCTSMDMAFINTLANSKLGTKLPNALIDVANLDQKLRQKSTKTATYLLINAI